MKKVSDYLHFYLPYGIRVFVFPDESITDGFLTKYREENPDGVYNPLLTFWNYDQVIRDGYKPILRRLSDKNMSTDELREWCKRRQRKGWMPGVHADNTAWLLSKGFDLFDLIGEGLAIDAKKIA